MSEVRSYRNKPLVVEAVRLSSGNLVEVAKWSHAVSASLAGLHLATPDGTMVASIGDWVMRNSRGEFQSCPTEIFQETYEPVED